MCGIAGLILKPLGGTFYKPDEAFFNTLSHRGPDDQGYLFYTPHSLPITTRHFSESIQSQVIFGHKRLSIIDLTKDAWQPMSDIKKRFFVLFNGEIYNFIELKEELKNLGYHFVSHSDTEVLLAGYQIWGESFPKKLIGIFAFAILDVEKNSIFFARDHFGVKPLYYHLSNYGFAFASEIKALLKLPWVKKTINSKESFRFLRFAQIDVGTDTLVEGIKRFPQAHTGHIFLKTPTELQLKPYWELSITDNNDISKEEASEKLKALFFEAINLNLKSDVSVGATLSGGIDSSSIVSGIRNIDNERDIHTFSFISSCKNTNEEKWVNIVSKHIHSHSHKTSISNKNLSKELDDLIYMQDEPFGSLSILAQYCVFKEVQKQGIKVTLDGQGADEVFGGYPIYYGAFLRSLLHQKKWREGFNFLNSIGAWGYSRSYVLSRMAKLTFPWNFQKALRTLNLEGLFPKYLKKNTFNLQEAEMVAKATCRQFTHFKEYLRYHLLESNLPALLRFCDRNSMHFSVEARVPFLYHKMVEFMFSLPESYFISETGETKHLLRNVMKGIVPKSVLERRNKISFQASDTDILRQNKEWVLNVLTCSTTKKIPFLNTAYLLKEYQDCIEDQCSLSPFFWRCINFAQWSELNAISF